MQGAGTQAFYANLQEDNIAVEDSASLQIVQK